MRPIDLLSSRYYSIKPKGHDGGFSRWRARPVMAAAVLLLMSLAVLLPAMVLAQTANQAPTGLTAVPGDADRKHPIGPGMGQYRLMHNHHPLRLHHTRRKDTTTYGFLVPHF